MPRVLRPFAQAYWHGRVGIGPLHNCAILQALRTWFRGAFLMPLGDSCACKPNARWSCQRLGKADSQGLQPAHSCSQMLAVANNRTVLCGQAGRARTWQHLTNVGKVGAWLHEGKPFVMTSKRRHEGRVDVTDPPLCWWQRGLAILPDEDMESICHAGSPPTFDVGGPPGRR